MHPFAIFVLVLVTPAFVVVAIMADFFGANELEGIALMGIGACLGLGWLVVSTSRKKGLKRPRRRWGR